MKSVLQTYFSEKLAAKKFYTGIIYELQDGTYRVMAQDGFVVPANEYTKEEIEKLEAEK